MQAGCRLADGYRGSVHEPPITRLGGFLISRRGDTDHLHDPGSRPGERTHFEICEQLSVEPQRGKDVLNLCRHDDCSPWTCDPKQAMGSDRPKIGAHIGMYRSRPWTVKHCPTRSVFCAHVSAILTIVIPTWKSSVTDTKDRNFHRVVSLVMGCQAFPGEMRIEASLFTLGREPP